MTDQDYQRLKAGCVPCGAPLEKTWGRIICSYCKTDSGIKNIGRPKMIDYNPLGVRAG